MSDWFKHNADDMRLQKEWNNAVNSAMRPIADSIGKRMLHTYKRAVLYKGLRGWTPLKWETVKRKRAHGAEFPLKVWYDHGILYNNLEYRTKVLAGEFSVDVGIWGPPDRVLAATRLELDPDLPARPLFRPEFERKLPELVESIERMTNGVIADLNTQLNRGP